MRAYHIYITHFVDLHSFVRGPQILLTSQNNLDLFQIELQFHFFLQIANCIVYLYYMLTVSSFILVILNIFCV